MRLKISSSPYLYSELNTSYVMRHVIFALIPAVTASIYFFGLNALLVIINCILAAVATEFVVLTIRKKPLTLDDFSAVLTGLLVALILPPSIKWYAASLGSIIAIAIGKHVFGGLGTNIFNPALIGRAFLMAAYPKMLTTFDAPQISNTLDAVSSATPLTLLKFNKTITDISDLFIGRVAGSLGETSAICLLVGGLYLLVRKIADWRIPLTMLVTVTIVAAFNPAKGTILFHLFSGGLLLGALFMATDPVTTPVTKKGRYIFGFGCAGLIMIIRYFSGLPEGVMYSILFMNALVPLINKYTRPRRYGT